MNDNKLLGRWGEAAAAEYLRKKGYKIVGMGYHNRFGEIDIIAENRKFVAFVEVKTRKNADFATAREFVDRHKRQRIITAARLWLAETGSEKQPRFDVIEIYAPEGYETKKPELNHMESAFWEE